MAQAPDEHPEEIILARHWHCVKLYQGRDLESCAMLDIFTYSYWSDDVSFADLAAYRERLKSPPQKREKQ